MSVYPNYKDSGVQWIGDIPSHWRLERAKFHFSERNERGNATPTLLAATQKYGMYPQELVEGVVKVADGTDMQQFKTVHVGDFVISLRSFQGGFERSDYEGVCSPAYQVFSADNQWNTDYLKFLFKNELFVDSMNSLTVGIREGRNIKYSDFANSILAIPPIEEQHIIADYLNKTVTHIDNIIIEAKASIEEYKAWKASIIYEAVTKGLDPNVEMKDSGIEWIGLMPSCWRLAPIKRSFTIFSGATPKSDYAEYWNGDITWITPADFKTQDVYVSSGRKSLTGEGYTSCGTSMIPVGSVIFSKRAPVGSVSINTVPLCTNQGCLSCVPNDSAISKYFYYIMSIATEQFELVSAGTTFKEISASAFSDFQLPLPPKDDQIAIADYLDKKCDSIYAIINEKEKLIIDLEAYKKSLIFEVVTGKRRVC